LVGAVWSKGNAAERSPSAVETSAGATRSPWAHTTRGRSGKTVTTPQDYAAWFQKQMRSLYAVEETLPTDMSTLLRELKKAEAEHRPADRQR
jgi:hypothetical protein